MKSYENAHRTLLPPRIPVILRVDGKAFHTLTKGCEKPFDAKVANSIDEVAIALVHNVQNARFAYAQSDEVSLLLIGYNTFNSQSWFDGNIQKMVSISASIASVAFTKAFGETGYFDSRVFILPEADIANYFLWRQQDSTRNSIHMVARSLYSHDELLDKNIDQMQEMIFQKGSNWNDYEPYWKRGRVITKHGVDRQIPIFSTDREYIEKFMAIEDK